MTSVGETLRRERERRNLELREISNRTKISLRLLEAIEAEQFEKLPGGVFTKNFVRQYARLLGLDEEEIAAELARELEPEMPQVPETSGTAASSLELPRMAEWETLAISRPRWTSSLSALGLMVAVIGLCSIVYIWWQRERRPVSETAARPVAPTVPRPQTATAQQKTQPAAQSQPAEQPGQGVSATSTPQNGSAAADKSAVSPASSTAANNTAAAPAQPTPANAAGGNGAVHVEMTAAEPVWVLARCDGKFQFSGTIEANQSRNVDANSSVVLRVGNAGGVNITLNGKSIGPLGPRGEARTVEFTPSGFQIVASAPAQKASDATAARTPALEPSDDATAPATQTSTPKASSGDSAAPASSEPSGDTPPPPAQKKASPGPVYDPLVF